MKKLKALVLPSASQLEAVCAQDTRGIITGNFDAVFNMTGAEYTKDQQDAMLFDAEVLLTTWGSPALDEASLEKAPNLKYVGHAAGTVKTRVPYNTFERGIRVFSAAGRIAESVAEWCLCSILVMLRRLNTFDAALRSGTRWGVDGLMGERLEGARVGIVSLSSTARELIALLAPFKCDILAYDPYVSAESAEKLGVRLSRLDEVMSSPIVSIHLPTLPSTKGMVTKELLSLIPDGGLFVNSARSAVIDEGALIDELRSGRIRAAIDVFDAEPLPADSLFRSLGNALITPHIAGATKQGHQTLMRCVVDDILEAVAGRPTRYEIDPAKWDLLA